MQLSAVDQQEQTGTGHNSGLIVKRVMPEKGQTEDAIEIPAVVSNDNFLDDPQVLGRAFPSK